MANNTVVSQCFVNRSTATSSGLDKWRGYMQYEYLSFGEPQQFASSSEIRPFNIKRLHVRGGCQVKILIGAYSAYYQQEMDCLYRDHFLTTQTLPSICSAWLWSTHAQSCHLGWIAWIGVLWVSSPDLVTMIQWLGLLIIIYCLKNSSIPIIFVVILITTIQGT